ncbi:MAG: AAA family ATPase [Cyanobacteria bacterium P01_G01_bin.54]
MILNLTGYQETEILYTGTRTLVYRAIQVRDQQSVIIKVLRSPHPNFNELVQFRNQYIITQNLDSPLIVKPLALERYHNSYALVMPDQGAVSLSSYWQDAQQTLCELLTIAIQIAEALHYLGQNRIIHKDIKPANILIDPKTRQVQLIDFSIASLLPREQQQLTHPKGLEGTLAYLSPEQTGRMNRRIDYRTDFYSLGVTLYELLTGRLPFRSDDLMELIHCHIAQAPTPPMEILAAQGQTSSIILSAIIMKLMAKNAEDRYQNSLGLQHDLKRCLQSLDQTGKTSDFKLGERDVCDRFLIPEKLYGRELEVQAILNGFERVTSPLSQGGGTEMMLVAGFSGIGKTAVVNEVHKPIVRQQGYFISGKFDQFNRNVPFSAFVQAFRDLMGQLLSESDDMLTNWQAQILEAVGENGQVLIEVIPELSQIIGQQPPAPALSGTAAQNRFNGLFEKFIAVFTTPEHPLVIFLDDLQWADLASLNLIKVLMWQSEMGYLLLLGAYRDNEVYPAHSLMLSLEELEKQGANISTISLTYLSIDDVNRLIADTLSCSVESTLPLTELVYQKTRGNPFFTTQFLKGLYEDELIVFNHPLGYWECDLMQVQNAALTDDVLEFMMKRLHKLPEATQDTLKLAACIGSQFSLDTLAIICERPSTDVATALWVALREGLVLPQSETYKFFQDWEQETEPTESISVAYRFLHDRVQQAAYALIPPSQKSVTHYKLGRLLLKNRGVVEKDEQIFEVVNNLNYGLEFVSERVEKVQIARLNLTAARKARKSVAYSAAVNFLDVGIQLLGGLGWDDEYSLTFDLYRECAENEYLQSNLERSESLAATALLRAKSAIDQAKIYNILIVQYTVTSQYEKAIASGRTALSLLGVQWHEDKLSQDLEQELDFVEYQLSDREIAALIELPEMEKPEKRSAIEILHNLLPTTFSINPSLWKVLVVKMVNLSLQYGNIAESCFGYSFYGVLVNSMFGDYKSGYEFGILSLNLSRKFRDLSQESKACNILAAFLWHWRKPIYHCESINKRGYEAGLESGQLQFIGYITYNRILSLFHAGKNLKELQNELSIYLPVLEKIKHYYAHDILLGCRLVISALTSANSGDLSESLQDIEEYEYIETCKENNSLPAICIYQILKAQALYLSHQYQDALKYLLSAQEFIEFIVGHFIGIEYNYYYSLVLLAIYRTASSLDQTGLIEQIHENQKQLYIWSKNCPENFQHKFDLIEAEVAQSNHDKLLALELYDRTIAGAKENGYIQDEALANELAAQFYLAWGKEKVAAIYLQDAYYCYAQWGAKHKIDALERTYPRLLTPILQAAQPNRTALDSLGSVVRISSSQATHISSTEDSQSSTSFNATLDLVSLFQASQAISSSIDLSDLLAQLTDILLQNSGSDRCAILTYEVDSSLQVQAIATPEATRIKAIALEETVDLPIQLLQYTKRTVETVVMDSPQSKIPVIDRYLNQQQPQSLLCLPLVDQTELRGILYLENHATKGVFHAERLTALNLLATQAAIALENARLYQQSQAYAQQLEQSQLQLVQSEKMSALGNLVSGVAHEINNPVGFLKGNIKPAQSYVQDLLGLIDIYQAQYPQANEQVDEEIEAIDLEFVREDLSKLIDSMNTGVERIQSISNSLRTFSRKDQEHSTVFNLHAGIESTLLILKHRTKANEQRPPIEISKCYGNIPDVQCFPGQLNQVFMNILANAIDAFDEMNQGKTYQEIEASPNVIWIQTLQVDKQIQIQIQDNGCGMQPETVERIFEQGFTTKEVGKGTGLGMAIAHQIITEKHGGTIECHSQLGQGTTFVIMLPLEAR